MGKLLEEDRINHHVVNYDHPLGITIQTTLRHRIEGFAAVIMGLLMPLLFQFTAEPAFLAFFPFFVFLGGVKIAEYTRVHICRSAKTLEVYRRNIFGIQENRKLPLAQVLNAGLSDSSDEPAQGGWLNIYPYRLKLTFMSDGDLHELDLIRSNEMEKLAHLARELNEIFVGGEELYSRLERNFTLRRVEDLAAS